MKVGIGYDIHALKSGRKLVLGGVQIPYAKGLLGHSDGDVLIHAVVDAFFGAMGEGDIGDHFPDSGKEYKNADSRQFALPVLKCLKKKRLAISHIDSTLVLEAPKLAPYKERIRKELAGIFHVPASRVSIKAKTNEGFDAAGKKRAIACFAVVALEGK